MKKLTRIAFLVTALVLAGFATAGAWQWEGYTYCYYSCGEAVLVYADEWTDPCCGTQHYCSNGSWGVAMSWDWRGRPIYCEI
jgi:fatty acid desaturase